MSNFCKWLLYKKWGWKKNVTEVHPDKFIIALAPHTSNMDFLIGQLYMRSEGMRINFLMKKEWFFWPLGPLFKRMGDGEEDGQVPVVHNTRRYPFAKPRLEEGLLLYCAESRHPYPTLRC